MRELWPAWVGGIAAAGAIVLGGLLVTSCVRDYSSATPQVIDVLIVDKHHDDGYYRTDCTTNSDNRTSCTTTWVEPTWRVQYADAERWWLNVSEGTYRMLCIGDKKILRYDLGGGYWRARYNERFEFGPVVAEGSWPAR